MSVTGSDAKNRLGDRLRRRVRIRPPLCSIHPQTTSYQNQTDQEAAHMSHRPTLAILAAVALSFGIVVPHPQCPPEVTLAAAAPVAATLSAPAAAIVDPTNPPIGMNIALAALGGRIVKAPSSSSDEDWRPGHLHDGTPAGWASEDGLPQEVVFAFHREREASVTAVVIDAWTKRTASMFQDSGGVPPGPKFDFLPRRVEIWTSTESATTGFTQVAEADLHPIPVEHAITFRQAVRAKFVKVRFVSSHGGRMVQAGEVKILESPDGPSVVADVPKNLAIPGLGGAIVRFTSQAGYVGRLGDAIGEVVGYLIDGSTNTEGWRSRDGSFPQDVVFAFHRDSEALIDRIVLHPKNSADPSTWIKQVTVAVSDHPLDGFREVGRFTVPR
jgi:hypothetical protein